MDKREFEEIKARFEKDTRKRKWQKYLNWLSQGLAFIGIIVIGTLIINSVFIENVRNIESRNDAQKVIQAIAERNRALSEKLDSLKTSVDMQSKIYSIDTSNALKLSDSIMYKLLQTQNLSKLEDKVAVLEKVILETPEKAVSIPLINKEIENLKIQTDSKVEMVEEKIDTIISLNRWILGLMFSLLITIVIKNLLDIKIVNKKEREIERTIS